MKRATFDEHAMSDRPGPAPGPAKRLNLCAAHGCPLAGSMQGDGAGGVCAYHYGSDAQAWSAITTAIHAHQDLRDVVVECRRWFASCMNPGAGEMEAMHKRMSDLLRMAGYEVPRAKHIDDLRGFAYRCEELLSTMIRRHVSHNRRAA